MSNKKIFVWFLPYLTGLGCPPDVFASSVSALAPIQPGSFVVRLPGIEPVVLRLDFQAHSGHKGYLGDGYLTGVTAPEASFQSCSWPIGAPDRDDHFSVRWRGMWRPGAIACQMRLRSDERAILYIDGAKALVSERSVAGVTTEISLDERAHDLRLDYSELAGPAFVFLEWRLPSEAWKPVRVFAKGENEREKGWKAEYFLGSDFEKKEFDRIDPEVFFQWGDGGPFRREEDLPQVDFRWGDEGNQLIAEFSSNRPGRLYLDAAPLGQGETYIQLEHPSRLRIGSDGADQSLVLEFDTVGQTADSESGVARASISVEANRPIRFWEPEGNTRGGESVSIELARLQEKFEKDRLRLTGALAEYDSILGRGSRWWFNLFIHRLELRSRFRRSVEPDPPRDRHLRLIESRLPDSVSKILPLLAPDLAARWSDLTGGGLSKGWAHQAFANSEIESLSTLQSVLTESPSAHSSEGAGEAGSGIPRPNRDADPHASAWRTLDLAAGLSEILETWRKFNQTVDLGESGAHLKAPARRGQDFSVENMTISENRFRLLSGANRTRIEDDQGRFLQIRAQVQLRDFRVNRKGDWVVRIQTRPQSIIEIGPPEKWAGGEWNDTPLLVTPAGVSAGSAILPSGSGTLRLSPTKEKIEFPIR